MLPWDVSGTRQNILLYNSTVEEVTLFGALLLDRGTLYSLGSSMDKIMSDEVA